MNDTSQRGRQAEIAHALAHSYLFADATPADRMRLAEKVGVRVVDAGAYVFHAGDSADEVYVLVSGAVKDRTLEFDGDEFIHFLHGPGETFGEPGFFAPEEDRLVDIVAVRRSIIVIIDRPTLTDYLGRHPATKDDVIRKMAQVWRWYTVAMTSLVMRPLLERISMRLIELAGSEPRRPDGLAVTPRLSQSTLASMVGVSRENLNRALAVMMHNGSVRRDGDRYVLVRESELRIRAAGGVPQRFPHSPEEAAHE